MKKIHTENQERIRENKKNEKAFMILVMDLSML